MATGQRAVGQRVRGAAGPWRGVSSRVAAAQAPHPDALGVAGVLAATAVSAWHLLWGATIAGLDALAFFYPTYGQLGARLAAGDLPGWNAAQMAGVPFLADPQSGWGYLPAMILFALLPLEAAARGFVLVHLLLAGLGAYALGRVLGMGAGAALVAAVAAQHAWPISQRGACCVVHTEVAAWLPAVLLAAELALQARSWPARIAWWGAAGFAYGQILSGWLGQGAYYAGLVVAAYLTVRVAFARGLPGVPRRVAWRPVALAGHGLAIVGWAGVLSAASLLPKLEYNGRTLLAGGVYRGAAAREGMLGGWSADQTIGQLLTREVHYAGGAVLVLAVLAVLAGRRHAAPAFATIAVGLLLLTAPAADPTPLQSLLGHLLPRFAAINGHWPPRAIVLLPTALALLAAAAVQRLTTWDHRREILLAVAVVPVGALWWIDATVTPVSRATLIAAVAAAALVALAALAGRRIGRLLPVALAIVVLVDLHGANRAFMTPAHDFPRLELADYYAAGGAGRFLRDAAEREDPFRFFGYDPGLWQPGNPRAPLELYRYFFADPRSAALLVNNRASLLGLHDVQGYNPSQPVHLVEYFAAMNGREQEYREANVYAGGLTSPLLDLLNARYAVVPATAPPDRADLQALAADWPRVYADAEVRVLRNPEALPRAWLVHEARRVAPGTAAATLASDAVDPRRVALLATAPPTLVPLPPGASDEVEIVAATADRIALRVRAGAAGLLVLSETHDPGWRATVDGRETPVLVANHVLRAVAVPAGEVEVVLTYTPPWLGVGLAVTALGLLALAATMGVAIRQTRMSRG